MYLKIGATTYKVVPEPDPRTEKGNECGGNISFQDSIIKVDSNYSKQKQMQILMHECLHGLWNYLDIVDDEHITIKLANGFYGFILDNKEYIKDIMKEDEKIKRQGTT